MNDHNCHDCKAPVGNGSRIRLVGRDGAGKTIELCSPCWIERKRDTEARQAREAAR